MRIESLCCALNYCIHAKCGNEIESKVGCVDAPLLRWAKMGQTTPDDEPSTSRTPLQPALLAFIYIYI